MSIVEVSMLYGNSVVTCSQAMLDNNAIASYNVFLSNLLRDYRLASHVCYFKNDVLSAQVQFTVKLYAERAFEYWVRENVPLSRSVDVRQTVRSTVVFAEARCSN